MKKIAAFTITELIVTFIISMIVVGLAFTVFNLAYRQLSNYEGMNDEYKELYQLYNIMQKDFHKASEITYSANELQMLMQSREKHNYLLLDEAIIRKTDAGIDTFYVNTQEVSTGFNKKESSSGLIDEINLTIKKGETTFPFHFSKEYAAETLINIEENI